MQDDPGGLSLQRNSGERFQRRAALTVDLKDTLLGEHMQIKADLVVLSTGMVPLTKDSAILNLKYRQGPFLPENPYGFNDSHFICFPYETQRTGIYTAGCVRSTPWTSRVAKWMPRARP